MRYWWVNQNQTGRQEIDGGYLWSPKRRGDGARNSFYENMREVAPGDLVLSFVDTLIVAIGVATSYCFEAPKPNFGEVGRQWDSVGWRVEVDFRRLVRQIRPKEHMGLLRPLLPAQYSPLGHDGNGYQHVYLAQLPTNLGETLLGLIGKEAEEIRVISQQNPKESLPSINDEVETWEHHLEKTIENQTALSSMEREALITARRGQGRFKVGVMVIEQRCRITGVTEPAHLRASHIKPWRDADNRERLDAENGLLLTPSIDHLFDHGFISFEDSGDLIIAPVAHSDSLERMGVPTKRRLNVGDFTEGQRKFLDYHRESVLLRSRRTGGTAASAHA